MQFTVWLWSLFILDLIGVAISNCINLAVVLNYSIQCEMIRYYVNTIVARLQERSIDIKSAMKVSIFAQADCMRSVFIYL